MEAGRIENAGVGVGAERDEETDVKGVSPLTGMVATHHRRTQVKS